MYLLICAHSVGLCDNTMTYLPKCNWILLEYVYKNFDVFRVAMKWKVMKLEGTL